MADGRGDNRGAVREYEISRQTAYNRIGRFELGGEEGLEELIRADLERRTPGVSWPVASTIGALRKREGLVAERRKRLRVTPYDTPLAHADAPNRVWCADFKGWFVCGDGQHCDPLTSTDAYSRFLFRCRRAPKTDSTQVRSVLRRCSGNTECRMRYETTNGRRLPGKAPAGLSRLSMWWLQLGIHHERIEPGCRRGRIKLSSVITDLLGASGRRMLRAKAAGETDPQVLATLGDRNLKCGLAALVDALTGAMEDIHRRLPGQQLDRIELIDRQIDELNKLAAAQMQIYQDPSRG